MKMSDRSAAHTVFCASLFFSWPTAAMIVLLLFATNMVLAVDDQRRLEPADVLALVTPSDPQISPDASGIVYVTSALDANHKPASELWWISTDGGAPKRITTDPGRDRLPRWSPDSATLTYLKQPKGEAVALLVARNMDSGRSTVLLTDANGVRDVQWSPDGTRLAVLQLDPDLRAIHDDAQVVGVHTRHIGLWIMDIQSGKKTRLSSPNLSFWTCRWSPDGKAIVGLASESPIAEGLEYKSRLTVLNVATGEEQVLADRCNPQAAPSYSPDGRQIAFMGPVGDFKERGIPHVIASTGGKAIPLLEDFRGNAWDLRWQPKTGTLLVGLTEGIQSSLASVNLEGEVTRLIPNHYSLIPYWDAIWSLSADGNAVAFLSEEDSPAREVWVAAMDGSSKKVLTDLNSRFKEIKLGTVEAIRWTNPEDKQTVEGILVKPAGFNASKPVPLVVWLHGGPAYNWGLGGHVGNWTQLLASRGYLVLLPNFRGSSGYGMDWMTANVRDWGDGPLRDVLSGVDHLITQGIVDAGRLFLGGGSYGGYLSFWAVTHTDRFQAAFVRAGISNMASEYALTDEPSFLVGYFGATPYEAPDIYRKASPLTFVKDASTPLLVIHGEKDARVPLEQGLRFCDALRHHGVPVEMVVYPGEGHSVRGYHHRLDSMKRLLEWFERWDPIL